MLGSVYDYSVSCIIPDYNISRLVLLHDYFYLLYSIALYLNFIAEFIESIIFIWFPVTILYRENIPLQRGTVPSKQLYEVFSYLDRNKA